MYTCTNMYIYMYIYVYIYTYIFMNIHTHIYMYICIYKHKCALLFKICSAQENMWTFPPADSHQICILFEWIAYCSNHKSGGSILTFWKKHILWKDIRALTDHECVFLCCVCMYVCVCIRVCTCVCTCAYVCMSQVWKDKCWVGKRCTAFDFIYYLHTHTHIRSHTHKQAHTHTLTHTQTHSLAHTHTHTYHSYHVYSPKMYMCAYCFFALEIMLVLHNGHFAPWRLHITFSQCWEIAFSTQSEIQIHIYMYI